MVFLEPSSHFIAFLFLSESLLAFSFFVCCSPTFWFSCCATHRDFGRPCCAVLTALILLPVALHCQYIHPSAHAQARSLLRLPTPNHPTIPKQCHVQNPSFGTCHELTVASVEPRSCVVVSREQQVCLAQRHLPQSPFSPSGYHECCQPPTSPISQRENVLVVIDQREGFTISPATRLVFRQCRVQQNFKPDIHIYDEGFPPALDEHCD